MAKQISYNQNLNFQIFFGGFLAYLLLHHFAIPLLRNMGRGDWLLWDTHWDILIHGIFYITIGFFYQRFKKINVFLASLVTFFVLSKYFWVGWDISQNKLNEKHFSQGISFLASLVFIVVFFLFYSKRFLSEKLDIKLVGSGIVAGLLLGQGFFFFEENYLTLEHYRYNYSKSDYQVKDHFLAEGIYPDDFLRVSEAIVTLDGFKPAKLLYQNSNTVSLISEIRGNTPFKLERWDSKRWVTDSSLILKYQEAQSISLSNKNAFFRLRNDSLANHPLLLLFPTTAESMSFRLGRRSFIMNTKDNKE